MILKGGVSKTEISDVETFDGADLITLTKFAKSGNTWPDSGANRDTFTFHDDTEATTGYKIPFAVVATHVSIADGEQIAEDGENHVQKFVRFTSMDGKTVLTLKKCSVYATMRGIREKGELGDYMIGGVAVGVTAADTYSLVHTP